MPSFERSISSQINRIAVTTDGVTCIWVPKNALAWPRRTLPTGDIDSMKSLLIGPES